MKTSVGIRRLIETVMIIVFVIACAGSVSAETTEWVVDKDGNTSFYRDGEVTRGVFAADAPAPDVSGESRAENKLRSASAGNYGTTDNPVYYYADEKGVVFKGEGWILDERSGKIYYAYRKGQLYNYAKVDIEGNTYIFKKKDCSLAVGAVSFFGKRYIPDSKGALHKDCVVEYRGNLYYAGADGALRTKEIAQLGDSRCYFGRDGRMVRNEWVKAGGKTYYALEDGMFCNDEIREIGGASYCFSDNGGEMLKGLFRFRDNYYFADSKGVIKKSGWINSGGRKYYAQSNGILYRYVMKTIDGKNYCFSASDGHVMVGSFTFRGKRYYADGNGVVSKSGGGGSSVIKQKSKLIDVSEFQHGIDWRSVKASGVNYAIIRLGFRGSATGRLVTDYRFHENMRNARRAGVKVGVYFFSAASTYAQGRAEAEYTIDVLEKNGYRVDLPVVIDSEPAPGGRYGTAANNNSRSGRTEAVKGFCEAVKKRGYTPMVYGSTSWLENKLYMSRLPYQVWVAQYYYRCQYSGKYRIWQYSSGGSVRGIRGRVDMNYIYY